ncbi:alpha/beta fold hydrolase [Paludibacterium yongneupense]|uniref:alpha/beta fold hydrolase n=1 Tax=Paludibacterium yongneupense TaxID=400061 RepID=UPI00041CD164|nr:alpha/beta hydrolase [Paludibacterium yongneupense]
MIQDKALPSAPPLVAQESAMSGYPLPSGFEHRFATVDGVGLHYVAGGKADGDVVVLLAGFPESGYAWRKVMPLLAGSFRVIAPDLPGQGDSDHPEGGYDTQSLAIAVHGLLHQIGASRYFLAAHDIGAWVAYPLAAMFGTEVRRLALLDAAIPGITLPEALPIAADRAWRTWHFAFHALPDLPETLITGREREYLEWFLRRKAADPEVFTSADIDEYVRVLKKDGGLRAGLAYYRAVEQSAQQNRELSRGGKLAMPVLGMGSDQGSLPDMAAPLRVCAQDVRGMRIARCGHFLPEEQPSAVAGALTAFFAGSTD